MESKIFELKSPVAYQVYQRDAKNAANIEVAGELVEGATGVVEARLAKGTKAVEGFDWAECAIKGNALSLMLESVPVGGPYTIEARVRDGRKVVASQKVPGILVGDLWILAGQSNMDGYGKLDFVEEPSPNVNCLYYGDYWGVAKDPLCVLCKSVDPIHWLEPDPEKRAELIRQWDHFIEVGAGLGVRFGKDMYKATKVPVGLLMCSHGGTSMDQWSPDLKAQGGDSLYGSMMRRVELAGGKVAGCLWYQGESDAPTQELAEAFKAKFKSFIEMVRKDLNQSEMPFIYVQIGRVFGDENNCGPWNCVQNSQLVLESEMKNVAVAAAIDTSVADFIHLDAKSQRVMGVRLANLALKLKFGKKMEVGPRPGEISFTDSTRTKLRISYKCVNGGLTPARGIRGFLVQKDNAPCEIKTCLSGKDGGCVEITFAEPVPEGAELWYGHGMNPCVNLQDKAGFAAPVFGPVELY